MDRDNMWVDVTGIEMIKAVIYLLAITAAEVVTTITVQPMWGMACHIVILAVMVVHSAIADDYRYRELVLSLALVPLIRIISLAMPLAGIPLIWWYPIIYVPLLVAAIVVVRILGYRANEVGLNFRLLPIQLAVALSGFLFGVAEYLILTPEPIIIELTWQAVWMRALIFLLCTGFVEEFIFRGVLQRSAVGAFGGWGIVYVSLVFAVVHLIHYVEVGLTRVLIDVAFVFIVALFFGWVVKRTGSLFGVSLSHGITNFMLYMVIPYFWG
jgi:membrane protease YdiL (CAAX protease family)